MKTKFKGLKVFKSKKFLDKRGEFRELFKKSIVKEKELKFTCYSLSKKNVLRGLHLQKPNSQGKYITVVKGSIFDVAVDLRKKSKTYLKHFKITLSAKNCHSIFIPKGFAHGFLGLDKENLIVYQLTDYRSKKDEMGIKWNDKDLRIRWPIKKPIVSKKDSQNITLKDYLKKQ